MLFAYQKKKKEKQKNILTSNSNLKQSTTYKVLIKIWQCKSLAFFQPL